jgi:hypothetical protein
MGTLVARGAVLRALNKDFGPKRLVRRSYGISRLHEYQAQHYVHGELAPSFIQYSELDGKRWVESLDWIIRKVSA